MKRYVVDTQCLVWFLSGDRRLPRSVKTVFKAAKEERASILAPSICLVEALFLLQRQRIPEDVVRELMALPETKDSPLHVVPLDMAVVLAMQDFGPAVVPELADRIIAATARVHDLPLLTVDHAIAESGLVRVIN